MKPRRVVDAARVCANAVPAGIIASSNGSAIVAPAPLRTVRRDRCFPLRNDITGLLAKAGPKGPALRCDQAGPKGPALSYQAGWTRVSMAPSRLALRCPGKRC